MPLHPFTLRVLPDHRQVRAIERVVTQMIAAFARGGTPWVLRRSGFWASREMLDSGRLGIERAGNIVCGDDAVEIPTLGLVRTERGALLPIYSRYFGRLHEIFASTAIVQWRAPNWELAVELRVPATEVRAPVGERAKRKKTSTQTKRTQPVSPPQLSGPPIEFAIAIANQWRRQERVKRMKAAGLRVLRPNLAKGSARILRSDARVVSGGLPGLGKRR